jgi:serine/threonine-protein kinase
MGTVWLARNEMTEREFAIKFLHPHAAQSSKMLQRFFQEARVSGKLRHPGLLEIFDVGTAAELGDAPFLVMELLDGAPLDAVIRRMGRLPIGMTLEIGAAVARAMAIAHDKGIVHRDLKPANVFLHRPGSGALVAKVLDFGISKVTSQPDTGPSLGLTQTGAVLGSPLYMSPEQVEGTSSLDGRSDLYSLGVVLWECLLGKAPYRATSYNLLIVEKLAPERPRLRDVMADAPPALDALVARLFQRDREKRVATARDLADALDALRTSLGFATMLDRPTAAQWLNAQMSLPSPPPPPPPEASTTGAVSVPRPGLPSQPSPAAYTVGEGASSSRTEGHTLPFAQTTPAPLAATPARAITAGTPESRVEPRGAAPAKGGSRAALAAGAAVVCLGAGLLAWRAATPSVAPAASASISAVPSSPPVAIASSVPVAIAPSASAAPVASASSGEAPSASVASSASPSVAPITKPASHPSHGSPRAAHGAKDAGAPAANRGIVDDGL